MRDEAANSKLGRRAAVHLNEALALLDEGGWDMPAVHVATATASLAAALLESEVSLARDHAVRTRQELAEA